MSYTIFIQQPCYYNEKCFMLGFFKAPHEFFFLMSFFKVSIYLSFFQQNILVFKNLILSENITVVL